MVYPLVVTNRSSHVTIEDLDAKTPAGQCPNCKLNVAFNHLSRRQVWPALEELPLAAIRSGVDLAGSAAPAEARPYAFRVIEHVLACQRCEKTAVVHQHWGPDLPAPDADNEEFSEALKTRKSKVRFVVLVHPRNSSGLLHEAAPAPARDLFNEGTRCLEAGAPRAAAGMYRACVEEICKDQGATGGNLKQKIARLADHDVPSDIVRDFDEARVLGNWSLHDGLTFSHDEVSDVASLIEEAVFLLYVQPEQRAAMRAARRQRRDQFRGSAGPTT